MNNFNQPFNENAPVWNMAVLFLTRLDKRLGERDEASQLGELLRWYRILRVIYRNVHFKVKEAGNEDLENELNQKFEDAKNLLSFGQEKNAKALAVNQLEILLDEIDLILNDLLYDYELVFGEKRKKKDKGRAIEDMF